MTEQSDIANLQAQIKALASSSPNAGSQPNSLIGQDSIISNNFRHKLFGIMIFLTLNFLRTALYTKNGVQTTTIKTALSELYNTSSNENNLITSKYSKKCAKFFKSNY